MPCHVGYHHELLVLRLRTGRVFPSPVVPFVNYRCTLVQGKYRVKFLVDGQWRLAPDW